MFQKFYTLFIGGLLFAATAGAQQFVLDQDTTIMCDDIGSDPHDPEFEIGDAWDNFELHNHLSNETEDTIKYQWQILVDETHIPEGWTLYGFCDNLLCRSPFEPWVEGEIQESALLAPGQGQGIDRTFKALIAAPSDAPNGQAIVRVRVWVTEVGGVEVTDGQVDTATYIFTKDCDWTSVNTLTKDDQRINIYPNPADDVLQVYSAAGLKASQVVVYDIIGRKQSSQAINNNSEQTRVNIATLAPGIYMIQVQDETGSILTTRKFVKK